MALTREEELFLIKLGIRTLTSHISDNPNWGIDNEKKKRIPWNKGLTYSQKKKTGAHKWTDAQRKKFSETMRKKWANRTNE